MKWVITIIMILMSSLSALAFEYKVQPGDTLSKVAALHATTPKKLYKANPQIAKRNAKYTGEKKFWLWQGQTIDVPEIPSQPVEMIKRNAKGIAQWKIAGGKPFGPHRDPALALMHLPDCSGLNLMDKMTLAVTIKHPSEPYTVKPGELFDWMSFDNYLWQQRVAWAGDKPLAAEAFREVNISGDRVCRVIRPEICSNPGVSCRHVLPPPPPAAKLPPPVFPPISTAKLLPTQPPPPPPAAKLPPPVFPPVSTAKLPPTQPQPPTSVQPIPKPGLFQPSYESFLFYGNYRNSRGGFQFYGTDDSIFPIRYGTDKLNFRTGLSVQAVGWDGHINTVKFQGHKAVIGAAQKINTSGGETTLKARYGKKSGEFTADSGQYHANESVKLVNLEAYHDFPEYNGKLFQMAQFGAVVDIDVGGSKSSTFNNSPIDNLTDPRTNGTEYRVWAQNYIYTSPNFKPYIAGQAEYRESDHNKSIEPKLGAKMFRNALDVNTGLRFNSGQAKEEYGVNLSVDINKVVYWIRRWATTNKTEEKKI